MSGWNDANTGEKKQLRTISRRAENPAKDLSKNMIELNQSVRYMSSMMVVMQNGIDQADRDVIQQFQDALTDLAIIFGLSDAGDTLNLDWGDLQVVLENIGAIFNFNFLEGESPDLGAWAKGLWDSLFARFASLGLIDITKLPLIPISSIGLSNPNLLLNPEFKDGVSMDGEGIWTWDGTVGRTTLGSAKTTADGTRKVLTSNSVLTTPGQNIDLKVFSEWFGAVSTGEAVKLYASAYDSSNNKISDTLIDSLSSLPSSSDWAELSGTYIAPAGTSSVRLMFELAVTATAGVFHFDDAELRKTATNLPQEWVSGLVDSLSGLWNGIEHLLDLTLAALGIPSIGTVFDKMLDLADELGHMMSVGEGNSSDISDLQDKTQALEGVIGYACSYISGSSQSFNTSFQTMNFDTQVGPIVGVSFDTVAHTYTLGSKGLWRADAQTFFDYVILVDTRIYMDIVVSAPGGSEFARRSMVIKSPDAGASGIALDNMQAVVNLFSFVVPDAGYKVRVEAKCGAARTMLAGLRYTAFNVTKISSETS